MRSLSEKEFEQMEQSVIAQLQANGDTNGAEKLVDTIVQISARTCRLMLQGYQNAISSPKHP